MVFTTKPSLGELIKTSWEFVSKNIWMLLGCVIVYGVLSGVLSLIPIISYLLTVILGVLFNLGWTQWCLNVVDDKEITFEAFKQHTGKFLNMLLAGIVYGIIVCIGCILLIIPGIWLALRLQFYPYFIVEENSGPIQAIQQSWELTKGEDGYLFIWLLAMIGLCIVGFICLIVGVFIASLIVTISTTCLYRYFKASKTTNKTAIEEE